MTFDAFLAECKRRGLRVWQIGEHEATREYFVNLYLPPLTPHPKAGYHVPDFFGYTFGRDLGRVLEDALAMNLHPNYASVSLEGMIRLREIDLPVPVQRAYHQRETVTAPHEPPARRRKLATIDDIV